MAANEIRNTIICGSGPAGLTAGIYLSRANLAPLLLAGPMPGGQLTTTTEVENFPGFPEGRDGNQLMSDMEKQARKYGTQVEYEMANKLRREDAHFVVESGLGTLRAHTVIVCTGATPRLLGLPSEKEYWNYGVHTCAVCDGGFYRGKEVAVIGGGDSAMEEASYLAKLCAKVTVVHRRRELRASKIMGERVLANPKIAFEWDAAIDEVLGETEGKKKRVTGLRLKSTKDGSTRPLAVSAMFVAIGHVPNSAWLNGLVDLDAEGYVKVNEHQETNVEGLYAAGDIHDRHFRQAITAAGYGCQAALEAERYLTRLGVTA